MLHLTCCLLPKSHRDSLEVLFSFLNWVASFSHIDEESGSKMDAHNLATVITPNILSPNSKTPGMDDSAFLAIEAVHSLIEYNEAMCEVCEGDSSDLEYCLSIHTGTGRSSITPQRLFPFQQGRRHHNQGNPEALWRHSQDARSPTHRGKGEFPCLSLKGRQRQPSGRTTSHPHRH